MNETAKGIVVHAFADTSGRGKKDWIARTVYPEGHPLAGLFAGGETVRAASEALARTVVVGRLSRVARRRPPRGHHRGAGLHHHP